MTRSSKTTLWTTAFIVLLLVIDQASKIWVKTSMVEGEMHEITSWFKIYFVENEGMAYGITLGSKLLLTLFRILAMGAGVYYLVRLLRLRRFSLGFCLTLGLVIAGGLGNVIDCLFYGEIFSTSRGAVAQLVPWGEGYGTFLHGKVVDMLYFPIIQTTYPSWSPIHAGEQFVFFSPIFNFADACISVGVALLLLCYRRTFSTALDTLFPSKDKDTSTETDTDTEE
jgi:signal peptidase II